MERLGLDEAAARGEFVFWSRRCRVAGLVDASTAPSNGWCSAPLRIDLTTSPIDRADGLTPQQVNMQLRSCARLVWLLELIARPQRVRSLGRIYSPGDCAPFLLLAAEIIEDRAALAWLESYAGALSFLYEERTGKLHTSSRVLERAQWWQAGLPLMTTERRVA